MSKKILMGVILLLVSRITYSQDLSNLLYSKLLNCTPRAVENLDCESDPYCGAELLVKNNNLFNCTLTFKSPRCLKWKFRNKRKTCATEENNYNVNFILNRKAVKLMLNQGQGEKLNLTYFLHGKLQNNKVVGEGGAVSRYKIEDKIKQVVDSPVAFVYPEYISDNRTKRKDSKHFAQFFKESEWLDFQNQVETFWWQLCCWKEKLDGTFNGVFCNHANGEVENIKFDSTTLIDALYAYPQVFAKIAKDYNRFGKFTSYGLFNRRLEKNSTYNNNVYLRNL